MAIDGTDRVVELFKEFVPEIADGSVRIKAISRILGYHSKLALESVRGGVDCIGVCVGVRGTRIKKVTDALFGEKIDLLRWDASPAEFIKNALRPAEVLTVDLDLPTNRALAVVDPGDLPLLLQADNENLRLAMDLTGWNIELGM